MTIKPGQSRRDTISQFEVWGDPIAKATDRIQSFLFRRGDVAPASKTIGIVLRETEAHKVTDGALPSQRSPALSNVVQAMGLVAKIVLLRESEVTGEGANVAWNSNNDKSLVRPDLILDPMKKSPLRVGWWDSSAASEIINLLRENKILSASNQTDPTKGLYQMDLSDGKGRIAVSMGGKGKKFATVITPKSEVSIFEDPDSRMSGDVLQVINSTKKTEVSIHTLDAASSLKSSSRMLMTHLTDARASYMGLTEKIAETDPSITISGIRTDQPSCAKVGVPCGMGIWPLKIRAGIAVVSLGVDISKKWTLKALDLRGGVVAVLPTAIKDNRLLAVLDNRKQVGTPTIYYELSSTD